MDLDLSVCVDETRLHTVASRRELHGIRQQIPGNLLKAIGVSRDHEPGTLAVELQANTLGVRRGPDRRYGRANDGIEIDWLDVQADLAGDDARDVEDVVDDLPQP